MTDVRNTAAAAAEADSPAGARGGEARPRPGLVRERLTARLVDPSSFRVGWVVAPAGTGKSRLLAHVAAGFDGPVAMCEPPDPVPRTEAAFTSWLQDRIEAADPGAVDHDHPLLVIIDDAHLLEGSEAEEALAGLVTRLPGHWRLLVATRMNLAVDLSRLRVSGQVVDIGPDDLRFRTWEVEELFRHVYREPMLPEEAAVLTRRTSGWAAYLQMFFLATSRRPAADRRSLLGSLRQRTSLVSDYLGRHVLAGLAPELRDFLVYSSALRRSTAALCDEFLGWDGGSASMLAELERRQLFTERLSDGTFHYHAVLLSYLDAELVEKVGLDGARREHGRAAALLEREGWTAEALAAYARAEDWPAVSRLLRGSPGGLDALEDGWVDVLPAAVLDADPLLLLARARSEIAQGALASAAATLRAAEERAASVAVADRCRWLRDQVLAWTEADRPLPTDWLGTIRSATQRQPGAARRHAASLRGVTGRFAEAVAALIEGDAASAARLLRSVHGHPDAPAEVSAAAGLLHLGASAVTGRDPGPGDVAAVLEEVERSGARWLARVARAGGAGRGEPGDDTVDDLLTACDREGDRWGSAAIQAADGLRRLHAGDAQAETALAGAAEAFRALGAGAVQSLLLAGEALAAHRAGRDERAAAVAARARALGAVLDVPAAVAVAERAGPTAGGAATVDALALLQQYGTAAWVEPAAPDPASRTDTETDPESTAPVPAAPLRLRCLGGFELVVGGQLFDESQAKPMERALLHLLATAAGSAVHRETLVAALWPEADSEAGLHRLQVAVSALRRLLGRAVPGGGDLLLRAGDSYRLALPPASEVDLAEFEGAAERAASARAAGDAAAERAELERAFSLYAGELLPADGPAEWVVEPRRRLAVTFTDVAARLAAVLIDGDAREACRVARAGIAADRFRDDLWKVLIDGAERGGHHAEAEAARRQYEGILEELGV